MNRAKMPAWEKLPAYISEANFRDSQFSQKQIIARSLYLLGLYIVDCQRAAEQRRLTPWRFGALVFDWLSRAWLKEELVGLVQRRRDCVLATTVITCMFTEQHLFINSVPIYCLHDSVSETVQHFMNKLKHQWTIYGIGCTTNGALAARTVRLSVSLLSY